MNKLIVRAGAAATAALTLGMLVAPSALAQDCTISDNGAFSHNRCNIRVVNKTVTKQTNNANIRNTVNVVSSTGGNKANFNTGGDVSVTSGDSSVTVNITNNVNSNSMP